MKLFRTVVREGGNPVKSLNKVIFDDPKGLIPAFAGMTGSSKMMYEQSLALFE